MVKVAPQVTLAAITFDPASPLPLYRQLYDRLRAAILSGQLASGSRLPSTRILADDLGVSRNTVVNAFQQLLAEGYLEGHTGDGTYVSAALPEDLVRAPEGTSALRTAVGKGRQLSRRGAQVASTPVNIIRDSDPLQIRPFRAGIPALDEFPFELWSQLGARYWRRPPRHLMNYADAQGYRPLREAISEYLRAARAVRCSADNIVIVSGSQQALDITSRLLLDPGDQVWIEDPGYLGARGVFLAAGARLVPVPVDGDGFNVDAALATGPDARMVYISPSHQYPMGVTLSLSRRLALLDWASQQGAWILEDDYDSEFRYASQPLAALQGLDREGRVIYSGTFSKVLFPGLRLGYLVVPPDLIDAFVAAPALADRHSPSIEQAVLADFIAEGHFARHIRRMRKLYAERQAALVEAANEHLTGLLDVQPVSSGMHLVGWLPEGRDDVEVSRRAAQAGIDAVPLSRYSLSGVGSGVLLGYAAFPPDEIRQGVERLASALRQP